MKINGYGLRTRRQQYHLGFSECWKCINGRTEFGNTDTRACMNDALSLLMFFFSSFSFVLVTLAGILWRFREGEFLLLGGLNWHFANVFRREYFYPAYIATRHMFILS
jgi:hypothetical protein